MDNKLSGVYGQTDLDTDTITINKRAHTDSKRERINENPDGSESLIDTLVHETMHAQHPRMHERTVKKKTKDKLARMGKSERAKLYAQVS